MIDLIFGQPIILLAALCFGLKYLKIALKKIIKIAVLGYCAFALLTTFWGYIQNLFS